MDIVAQPVKAKPQPYAAPVIPSVPAPISQPKTAIASKPTGVPASKPLSIDLPSASPESTLRIRRRFRISKALALQVAAVFMILVSGYISVTTWLVNAHVQAQTTHDSPIASSNNGADPQVVDGNQNISEAPITNFAAYKVPPQSPRFVYIDKFKVQARVFKLGIGGDGALQTPHSSYDVGWYTESAGPGENGAMLLDGHALGPTKPGVFYDLKKLASGDTIRVERGDGKTFTYVVQQVSVVNAQNVPMDKLLVPIKPGAKGLNLISCTGVYNAKSESFNQRALVYAILK